MAREGAKARRKKKLGEVREIAWGPAKPATDRG